MPDQQSAAQPSGRGDHTVTDRHDLDDPREYVRRIKLSRRFQHGSSETVASHHHLGDNFDDQRGRQCYLQPRDDLGKRRRHHDLPGNLLAASTEALSGPDELAFDALYAGKRGRNDRENGADRNDRYLGSVEEAEPKDEDRKKRNFRHRKPDRDDRIQEPV